MILLPSVFFLVACFFSLPFPRVTAYSLVHDYHGTSFFDTWDFYGFWDNLTLGDVWWLNRDEAFASALAYVNNAGNVILKMDNMHYVETGYKRNSVRITTQASYDVGSLWVIDLLHIPYGCSVWPAFWTMGPKWPDNGEIDIIESINLRTMNQMALHTTPGCTHSTPSNQISQSLINDCSLPSGCSVQESQPNSFSQGFAANGGGVWATQFDVSGIYIWYWPRENVPASITNSDSTSPLWVDDFGAPSAAYPSTTCNITQFFTPQKLVLDITACGTWAGLNENFPAECAGSTGHCYNDAVVGDPSRFNDAYFEIKYVRAYTTGSQVSQPTATPGAAQLAKLVTLGPPEPRQTTITPSPAPTHLVPSSPLFYPGSATMGAVRMGTVGLTLWVMTIVASLMLVVL